MTGLLGGAFDPPHNGHLAVAGTALDRFGLERLLVLVVAAPAHKAVETPVEERLELSRLAFAGLPRTEVVRDDHAYTVESLVDGGFADGEPLFLVGADEFSEFLTWRKPEAILGLARVGVATRPGYPRERLEPVLARLERPDRVEFFEIPAVPVSSTEIRSRVRRGESIDELVPEAVAQEIRKRGLYRPVDRRRTGEIP